MGLLKNIANSAWSHAKKGAGTIWKGAKAVGSGLKKGGSMLVDAYKDLDDDTKNRVASLVGGGIQALGSLPTPVAPLLSAIGAGAKHILKGSKKSKSDLAESIQMGKLGKSSDGVTKNDVGKSTDNPWTVATKAVKGIINSKTGRRKYAESAEPIVETRSYVSNLG